MTISQCLLTSHPPCIVATLFKACAASINPDVNTVGSNPTPEMKVGPIHFSVYVVFVDTGLAARLITSPKSSTKCL